MIAIILVISMILAGCKSKIENTKDTSAPVENTVAEDSKEEPEAISNENTEKLTMPAMHFGSVDVKEEVIYEENFEGDSTEFTGRGAAKVEIVSGKAYEGSKSLYVSGRTALWNGATVNLTEKLEEDEAYLIKAYIMYEEGPDKIQIDCKVEKNNNEYLNFASAMASKGEWTEIVGKIIIPAGTNTASVYFETGFSQAEISFIDFYIDDISIKKETVSVDRGEIPSLKEIYKDYFSIGVAATVNETPISRQGLMKEQFNSLTPGNELKPDSLLDYATCISDSKYDDNPAVQFSRVEYMLQFAKEAGIPMRGHTLVWHSQTPRWFFAQGYSKDENAPLVSKELMLRRLENYIKNVLEYLQSNYPGIIYAWDVVNEAVEVGHGQPGGLRSSDSLWYQVVGPEFIEKAFEYTRKYVEKDVKLFYNDYNTEDPGKMLAIYDLVAQLKEKGLVDGIGLQSHFQSDNPSLVAVENSIRRYAELGLEIQITELDMDLKDNTEEAFRKQAMRYKRFFTIIKNLKETGVANITNVTFWGLSDDISWLNKPGQPSYPLLFDNYLVQKPAFWGVALSPDIPLY